MSDESIEGLKQAYMNDKDNKPDECSMSHQVTDYAFGELDAENAEKVKEHLKSCRSCFDLYMDIKMAEEDAEQTKNEKVEGSPDCRRPLIKERSLPSLPGRRLATRFPTFSVAGSVLNLWPRLPLY